MVLLLHHALPNGNFRVDCRAQSSDAATSIEHLKKECENEVEVRDWACEQAGARGFNAVIEEEPWPAYGADWRSTDVPLT